MRRQCWLDLNALGHGAAELQILNIVIHHPQRVDEGVAAQSDAELFEQILYLHRRLFHPGRLQGGQEGGAGRNRFIRSGLSHIDAVRGLLHPLSLASLCMRHYFFVAGRDHAQNNVVHQTITETGIPIWLATGV